MLRKTLGEQKLGERLVEEGLLSEEQLGKALQRQRLYGGRLGTNLVDLGFLRAEELRHFFRQDPPLPQTVEGTGLELNFIADLVLKHLQFMGDFSITDLAARIKLSLPVLDKAIDLLRRDHLLEVKGASQFLKQSFTFHLTEQGKYRASRLLEICSYVGPAPVTLDQYREMVQIQTIKSILVDEERLRQAFAPLVIDDKLLVRLGPAVSSGRAIFLYGPPGNGKTTIAETLGQVLPGTVYIPHSLLAGGELITLYDPVTHAPVNPENGGDQIDGRWILIHRPVILAGGEFTLRTLDLEFNPLARFYQAPLQMKANNGLFIMDDFGRQQVEPHHLLNRWIVPLERRTDFLTLHTGMKFTIPFDQLVIFATNIEPKKLVDEAFLRRIRYKIRIEHPSREEYEQIFRKVCDYSGVPFDPAVFDHLVENYHKRLKAPFNACMPRDIVDHLIDAAHYRGEAPTFTREAVDQAWENYYVNLD